MLLSSFSAQADLIDGEELVDPTMPFGARIGISAPPGNAGANYKVSFIRAGGNAPVAVINEQQVSVGDLVDGAQVTAIERDQVTLLVSNERVAIRLFQQNSKTAVNDQ
jgi:hypothetical protein